MNWFILGWKNAFDFAGRSRRKEFWMFYLFNILAFLAVVLIGRLLFPERVTMTIFCVYWLMVLIPSLSIHIRRLHDIGKSGWWLLVMFIPVVGPLVIFVFNLMNGFPGDNEYGVDPKAFSS